MVNRPELHARVVACVRHIWLIPCMFVFMVGCGSHQHTRISHALPQSQTNVAELEETPLDVPLAIRPASIPMELEPPSEAESSKMREESAFESSAESAAGPHADVFASSGKGTTTPSVTLPDAPSISDLAMPRSKQNLPFTLSDIFFDYDRYTLKKNDLNALETNAKVLLARYPKKKVLIQGHCDERGTEEYNLALGVRRAQAVKDYLVDLGVPAEKLQVLSYGKEKPFCTQHSWNCWKHNRRSHFVFQ